MLAVVFLLLAALGALWYFVLREPAAPEPPVAETEPPAPAPPPPAPGQEEPSPFDVEVPPLGESDPVVRRLAELISSRPELAEWLLHQDLLRRFVAVVENVAEGKSPNVHVPFLRPKGDFKAEDRGGALHVDPASYGRYDVLAGVVSSLDAEACARLYTTFEPLLTEAYRELGYPDRSFRRTLGKALDHLQATPVVSGEPVLREEILSYAYADPRLEALSPAQKQLLRMGPENVRRIKDKLAELSGELGL